MKIWENIVEMWETIYTGSGYLFDALMDSYSIPLIGEVSIIGLIFGAGIGIFITTAIVRSFLS